MFSLNKDFTDGKLTYTAAGRLDATTATELDAELAALSEGTKNITFDFDGLEYISSAGLRSLMKFRKAAGANVAIINASPEVYDIFEMTGFNELFTIKKRLREISVDGCEVIGRGFYGTVYRLDEETIVKVYSSPESIPMIENEKKMARMAFLKGIPTAISYDIVRIGDSYGSVFEMLNARTFNDLLIERPNDADDIIRRYVDFLKLVHGVEMDEGALPQARDIFIGYLDAVEEYLDAEQTRRLRELFAEMPDDLHVVHGDIQMKNVMLVGDEPMLIDMDTLSCGQPVFDLAGIYLTYRAFGEDEPGNSMAFLGISEDMSIRVWRRVLEYYVGSSDGDVLRATEDRVRLLSYVRFLYLLAVTDLKNGDLGRTRIEHTRESVKELLDRVYRLTD